MFFHRIKKLTSLLLTFFLLFSDLARANPARLSASQIESKPAIEVSLPPGLGTVRETYLPGQSNQPFIFHLQTVHANYENALKTSEIIHFLESKYKVKLLFVEGASGRLHSEFLQFFPDLKMNAQMLDQLAQQGELTGADLSLSEIKGSNTKVEAIGIESLVFYRRAFKDFKKVLSNLTQSEGVIAERRRQLDTKASKVFSREFRKLVDTWQAYEASHRDFNAVCRFLKGEAKSELDIDFENPFSQFEWPGLTRLVLLSELEKRVDAAGYENEKERLKAWLSGKGIHTDFIQNLESKGSKDTRSRYEKFLKETYPQGFRFKDYTQITYRAATQVLQSELEAESLFSEINRLFEGLFKKKAKTKQELTLLGRYQRLQLLDKLLRLELNRKEWEKVKRILPHRPVIQHKKSAGAAGSETSSFADVLLSQRTGAGTAPYPRHDIYRTAIDFYRLCEEREKVFYQRLSSEMSARHEKMAILVTGGFHREGMARLFQEKGIGYAEILPRISGETNSRLYHQVMLARAHLEKINSLQRFSVKNKIDPEYARSELRVFEESFAEVGKSLSLKERVRLRESSPYFQDGFNPPSQKNFFPGTARSEMRSHEMEKDHFVINALPLNKLLGLELLDMRLPESEERWPRLLFEHVEQGYKAKAIVAKRGDAVIGYMVYQALPSNLLVLRYAVDPKAPRGIIAHLWKSAQNRAEAEGKAVLKVDVPFEDLAYFGTSPNQEIKKLPHAGEREFYAINYYVPKTKNQKEELSDPWGPVEIPPTEDALLKAWIARQEPGREAKLTFKELQKKYSGLTPSMIRRSLGEYFIKPKGGYPEADISYREMEDSDVYEIMKIEKALFEVPERWSPYGFMKDEKGDETKEESGGLLDAEEEKNFRKRFVAIVNRRIVGYLVFKIFDERIDILKMVVDPSYRFSYIGKSFVDYVKKVMDENSLSFIAVDVENDQFPAVRYFEKQGFVKLEEQDQSWNKKNNTEMVYWHPDIDATPLRNKKQAARYFKWIKQTKARMEELEKAKLEESPKGVIANLKRKDKHPWKSKAAGHGFTELTIREARINYLQVLVRFASKTSRFEWTLADFQEFLQKGGRILIARSGSRIIGFLALTREGTDYEILDAAFAPDIRFSTLLKRFIKRIQLADSGQKNPAERLIWEMSEEEFNDLNGRLSLIGAAHFRVLDGYDLKQGNETVSAYLLERSLFEIPQPERLMRLWAQSLERHPVAYKMITMQAEEFGVTVDFAYDILQRFGVKVPPPEEGGKTAKGKPSLFPPKDRETYRVHIRWMIQWDMPEVLKIEEESYKNPWMKEGFLRVLRQRNCIGMVSEQDNKVVGFMIYELYKSELHIINFAVSPSFRRRDVGRQMIEKLKGRLGSQHRTRLLITVRENNLSAQLFLRKSGFKAVSVMRNNYDDTGEDAYVFEYNILDEEGISESDSDAPAEAKVLTRDLLRAWAKRQPLEGLKDEIVKARYPEVWGADHESILDPIRREKLAETLRAGNILGSGQTVSYTLGELSRLAHLPANGVLRVLGSLGLKAREQDDSRLKVAVRDSNDADFNAYENIDASDMLLQKKWTYSDFVEAQNRGFHTLTAVRNSQIVGYVLYRQDKGNFKILKIAALPNLRFRGIEEQLIKGVKDVLRQTHLSGIVMNVPEGDLYQQRLLKGQGFLFQPIRTDRGYISKGRVLVYKRKPLTGERRQQILQDIQSVFLHYQEGALALHLERRQGKSSTLLRASLENFDSLLKRWFDINAVVRRETETLTWHDPDTSEWVTRSLRSPVEIKKIQQSISQRIETLQRLDTGNKVKQGRDEGSLRSEMPSVRSELRTLVSSEPSAPRAEMRMDRLKLKTMPEVSSFRLMQLPVMGTDGVMFMGPEGARFLFAREVTLGVAGRDWPPDIKTDFRNYLRESVLRNFGNRGAIIDWRQVSTFSILAENQSVNTEPVKIIRVYDQMPQIDRPELQILADFLAHNKNAQLFVQVHGGEASELGRLESDVRREILKKRKAIGVESKGVNVKVVSTGAVCGGCFAEAYLKGLRVSNFRALVYGNDAGELNTLFSSIPPEKRDHALFVHNDAAHTGHDELKEAHAILAALAQLLSPHPIPPRVVSVLALLSERIALAQPLERLVKQAA